MMETDGCKKEERVVFCQQVGYTQTRVIIDEGAAPPCVRIELRYDDTYRNDMPPKFESLPALFRLVETYEARLLGEALITAAQAAEAAVLKHGLKKSDGRIAGAFTDGGILRGPCKHCGQPIIINDGTGLRWEVCQNCGKPQEPEIYGCKGSS